MDERVKSYLGASANHPPACVANTTQHPAVRDDRQAPSHSCAKSCFPKSRDLKQVGALGQK